MDDRDRRLSIRISAGEQRMLREVAQWEGLSASDCVRLCIRREHERLSSRNPTNAKQSAQRGRALVKARRAVEREFDK
jgi:uncharacterized protein (DUF1778 family)